MIALEERICQGGEDSSWFLVLGSELRVGRAWLSVISSQLPVLGDLVTIESQIIICTLLTLHFAFYIENMSGFVKLCQTRAWLALE